MSSEQEHRDRTERESHGVEPEAPTSGDGAAAAQEVSEQAAELVDDIDALLDDVDQSLRQALGIAADEVVAADELERRAATMVAGYQQKGGQ